MARKVNKNLVALGSAAVVTIYALGFAQTETATQPGAAAAPSASASVRPPAPAATAPALSGRFGSDESHEQEQGERRSGSQVQESGRLEGQRRSRGSFDGVPPAGTSGGTGTVQNAPGSMRAALPTPAAAAAPSVTAPAAGYRDGTYTGSGTSRFGGFEVAVQISGGTITNVDITKVSTRYPVSRVAALPAQVVARQSSSVDLVSGATYSARAFQDAIAQALAQARG